MTPILNRSHSSDRLTLLIFEISTPENPYTQSFILSARSEHLGPFLSLIYSTINPFVHRFVYICSEIELSWLIRAIWIKHQFSIIVDIIFCLKQRYQKLIWSRISGLMLRNNVIEYIGIRLVSEKSSGYMSFRLGWFN